MAQNEAALITSDTNRLYVTGFKSSAGAVIITKSGSALFIDFRYFEKASKSISHLDVKLAKRLFCDINLFLKELGVENILIEADNVTVSGLKSLKAAFKDFSISDNDTLSKTLINMRTIKNGSEIELIKKAQLITDQAFSYICSEIKAGVTEREIALKLEFFMREQGSEGVAFDSIVVSGKNSSLPHGVPTDKKIESGDFVTLDFGAVCEGYRSDMTRTVALGQINEKQKKVYDTVLAAQKASLNAIKPTVKCCDIDKAARDLITNNGFGEFFGHGLGHSVGLEIHENPACNTRDETPLKAGMIMTVEPGIYLPDEFGVRIEDMVVVRENGYLNLTKSPKELIIL